MAESAIEINGLTKSYDDVHALNGVNIKIEKGEFFGKKQMYFLKLLIYHKKSL